MIMDLSCANIQRRLLIYLRAFHLTIQRDVKSLAFWKDQLWRRDLCLLFIVKSLRNTCELV